MKRVFWLFLCLSLLLFAPLFTTRAYAADIRANNMVTITSDENNLHDLYLFGNQIHVGAPVTNDLVAVGGNISVDNNVSGSVIAAGGTLNLKGNTGNTMRVAGGTIIIEGKIVRDLVVAGGNITITKTATVEGDLVAAGGQIIDEGAVNGKIIANGGDVIIDGPVGKSVEGRMSKLTIGSHAVINGPLTYSAYDKATVQNGAEIKGGEHFTQMQRPKQNNPTSLVQFFLFASLYKLLADMIISVLLIFFLAKFIIRINGRITASAVQSGAYGFAYLILAPVVCIILLVLPGLGVGSFFFYLLSLTISVYLAKVFTGWLIIHWWEMRNSREYKLDWKAGIIGPLVLFIIGFIPILGWLIATVIYLITLGAIIQELAVVAKEQRLESRLFRKK